jgi:hypothetical protein
MFPANFGYFGARSVEEALALLTKFVFPCPLPAPAPRTPSSDSRLQGMWS